MFSPNYTVFFENFPFDSVSCTNGTIDPSITPISNINDGNSATVWSSTPPEEYQTGIHQVILDYGVNPVLTNYLIIKNTNLKEFTFSLSFDTNETIASQIIKINGINRYQVIQGYSTIQFINNPTFGFDNNLLDSCIVIEFEQSISLNYLRFQIANNLGNNKTVYIGEVSCHDGQSFLQCPLSKPSNYEAIAKDYQTQIIRLSGGGAVRYIKSSGKYYAKLNAKNLFFQEDRDLIKRMIEVGHCIVYPNGGNLNYTVDGMGIDDIYEVVVNGNVSGTFAVGRVQEVGTEQKLELFEV